MSKLDVEFWREYAKESDALTREIEQATARALMPKQEVELGRACVAAYNKGYTAALDAVELRLRRHFQKLWPQDEHCARIVDEVRKALES